MSHFATLRLLLLALFCGVASPAWAQPVDFPRDIFPIFESRCFECHGPKKQKNGLRLDRPADALRGGDSGKPAYVPGQSGQSQLVLRVTTNDPDEMMPPKGDRLTPAQIAALRAWIDAGAKWPEDKNAIKPEDDPARWAFKPPVRSPVPVVKRRNWAQNSIDQFILARLEREKLSPAAPADKATLLRRATFDLHGLPPTPAELDASTRTRPSSQCSCTPVRLRL